jgi:hypothetical protein
MASSRARLRRLLPVGVAFLALLLALAVVLWRAPLTDDEVVPSPTAPEAVPYDPSFALRRPIGDDPAIDPRSAAIVERLARNAAEDRVQLAVNGETPPVYRVDAGDPFLRVRVGEETVRFRVPEGARPGSGQDHPLVLLDRDHPDLGPFVELRLFQAEIDREAGEIRASGAGLFHYNNDGRRLNPDGSPSVSVPFAGGGTGSGLSILAGLVRPQEVAAGRIEHAIRFSYSNVDAIPGFRPPAVKSDQPKGVDTRDPASAMQIGTRLQLDPAVDCARRTVPGRGGSSQETRFLRMFCVALQRYGMVMLDGTAPGNVFIPLENLETAPWDVLLGTSREGGYGHIVRSRATAPDGLSRNASSGIPWERMRVLAP